MRQKSRTSHKNAFRVGSAAALTVCASLFVASSASAQEATPKCKDLGLPNPLYLSATTLLEGLMEEVGPVLADPASGPDQMSVIYFPASSCTVYTGFRDGAVLPVKAKYYTKDGHRECEVDEAEALKPDLVAMDVGGKNCPGGAGADLKEYPSHVETLGFVVPRTSTQMSITATEGYYLMKFAGQQGKTIAPWTDPKLITIRNSGSSTQLTIGANIGIPGTQWNPSLNQNKGSGDVRDKVSQQNAQPTAEATIGILNSSKWEKAKDSMRVLAFEPFNGCLGALYPDSTETARDKRNVRDGHYPIWTNLRYVLRKDAQGKTVATNAARADRFLALMTGQAAIPNLPLTKFVVDTGNIPACAMHVKRDEDGGPISPFAHPAPCHCSFLNLNGIVSPECVACTDDTQCNGKKCRDGFCEDR